MKRWISRLWVIVPVLLVAGSMAFAWKLLSPQLGAQQVGAVACVGGLESDFACWQSHYKALVANESVEKAFEDFRTSYDTKPYVKSNCHQIGHVIGRAAVDRHKTLAETYAHGDTFCWSGYYHGAIETIAQNIGGDKIVSQLNTVCQTFDEQEPYSFKHYNCVHGMGHGLMAVKDGELFDALKVCSKYDGYWQQESCYGGVFMENVMNRINPGKTTKYLNDTEPLYPCTAVDNTYKQQCYLMQTSHALTVVGHDFAKVFELCAGVETPYDVTCYQSLGRDVSGQSSSNAAITVQQCMLGATHVARENCFTGAVKDFISYFDSDKQGLEMCGSIPDASLAAGCKSQAEIYYRTF